MSHSSFNSAETSLYAYAAARVDGSNRISPRNGLWTRGACVGVLIVAMFVKAVIAAVMVIMFVSVGGGGHIPIF